MDSTYEAITNHLDEKRLEARDLFVEYYVTDPLTTPEDSLVIEVYVPVKYKRGIILRRSDLGHNFRLGVPNFARPQQPELFRLDAGFDARAPPAPRPARRSPRR